MRRTKTNLVRFLALLMAFGMLMGMSLIVAASPMVVLSVTLAAAVAGACLFGMDLTTTAPNARGRPAPANGDPVSDQFTMLKPQRRYGTHGYPTGFRCWLQSCSNNRDGPMRMDLSPSKLNLLHGPRVAAGATLARTDQCGLYAFNANDQGVQAVHSNMIRSLMSTHRTHDLAAFGGYAKAAA